MASSARCCHPVLRAVTKSLSVPARCCTHLSVISRRTGDVTKKPKPALLPQESWVACQTDALKAGSPLTHTQSCLQCSHLSQEAALTSLPMTSVKMLHPASRILYPAKGYGNTFYTVCGTAA